MMRLKSVRSGKSFRLGKSADEHSKEGGEGRVFPSSCVPIGDNLVAKIYNKYKSERVKKLKTMLSHSPSNLSRGDGRPPVAAWPIDLLRKKEGKKKIVGYLMPEVVGTELYQIHNPQDRRDNFPLIRYDYLLRCAVSTAEAVSLLHQEDYVIGDINESNLIVSNRGDITVIDADSFQIKDPSSGHLYGCNVGKREYLSPEELEAEDLSSKRRKKEHDRYALGVIISQLLLCGRTPLELKDGNRYEADNLIFPYAEERQYDDLRSLPMGIEFNILGEPIRELFVRCFHRKKGFNHPSLRPSAEEWTSKLRQAEEKLTTCFWNRQHKYSSHLGRFGGCPWCKHKDKRPDGKDLFPSKFRVGKRRVEKGENHGFLQVDMPDKSSGKWIGVMGVAGMVVGGASKALHHAHGAIDHTRGFMSRARASLGDAVESASGIWDKWTSKSTDFADRKSSVESTGWKDYGLGGSDEGERERRGSGWGGIWSIVLTAVVTSLICVVLFTNVFSNLASVGILGEQADLDYSVQVDPELLNVRVGPSSSRGVVTTVQGGKRLDVLDTSGGWEKVRFQTNDEKERVGWVYSEYTSRIGEWERIIGNIPNPVGEINTKLYPDRVKPIHEIFLVLLVASVVSAIVNKLLVGKYIPNWGNGIFKTREDKKGVVGNKNYPIKLLIPATASIIAASHVANFSANTLLGKVALFVSVPLSAFSVYVSYLTIILAIPLIFIYNIIYGG